MITIIAITLVLAVSYLFTTGLAWLLLMAINAVFSTSLHPNIWWLGLLLWLALFILKSIFKK